MAVKHSNKLKSDFGEEVLLVFVGYSRDGGKAAETIVELEKELQRELDKLKRVNRSAPYRVVKIWKWESDAAAQVGGQAAVISPHLERADIAVFVFNERVGEVAWQELTEARTRKPPIPVLPFFPSQPPSAERLMQSDAIDSWSDLIKKKQSLAENWTDPESSALTPLPTYKDLGNLGRLAADRITNEIVRLVGQHDDSDHDRSPAKKSETRTDNFSYKLGFAGSQQRSSEGITSNVLSIAPGEANRYSATIVPTLVDYRSAALICDPTGQIYDLTADQRERFGPIVKLDPWSILTPDSRGSDGLNPFDIYQSLGVSTNDSIRLISESFFPYRTYQYRKRERSISDPFWPEMQRKLLIGLFHAASAEEEGTANILPRVAKFVHSDDIVYNLAKKLDESSAAQKAGKQEGIIDPEGYREIAAFLQQADNTRSGILAGVSHALGPFLSPRAEKAVEKTTFDVERWLRGDPMTIYVVGSSLGVSALDSMFNTWMSALQSALLQGTPRSDRSSLIVIDIHESFSIWPGLISALCHRSDIQGWILSSDRSEIDWAFEEFSEQVINSVGIFQIFRPRNWNSAKSISELVNYSAEKLLEIGRDECVSVEEGVRTTVLKHFE